MSMGAETNILPAEWGPETRGRESHEDEGPLGTEWERGAGETPRKRSFPHKGVYGRLVYRCTFTIINGVLG